MKKIWSNDETRNKRAPYETPAIIYEGLISTRAGTVILNRDDKGVDPAQLFDN